MLIYSQNDGEWGAVGQEWNKIKTSYGLEFPWTVGRDKETSFEIIFAMIVYNYFTFFIFFL